MSYRHIKKTVIEVIAEALSVDIANFRAILMKYNVSTGCKLEVRFGGPANTKIWEFKRSNERIRLGTISYLYTPVQPGYEINDNFTDYCGFSNLPTTRTALWKVDLGAVYNTIYLLFTIGRGGTGALTYYIKKSVDGSTYEDVFTNTINSAAKDYKVVQISNARYIGIDGYSSDAATSLYLYEIFGYSALEQEKTVETDVTVFNNVTFNALIDLFILGPSAATYWGGLLDNVKATIAEGILT